LANRQAQTGMCVCIYIPQ